MNSIIDLMDAGLTYFEIAVKLGLTESNATNLCQQERMRRGELLGHIDPEMARRLYIDEAKNVAEIAAHFACSVAYLKRYLHAFGIFRDQGHQVRAGTRKGWNTGLTKDTNETLARMAKAREGENNPMAGRVAWNAGLTADDHPSLASISRKMKGRTVTDATRDKMADAKLGKRGVDTNRWKGGHSTSAGYLVGEQKKYKHRMIAETLLGRQLDHVEHVHHIDKDKTNNDPSNLLVLSNSAHTLLHRAMRVTPGMDQRFWLAKSGFSFIDLQLYAEIARRKVAPVAENRQQKDGGVAVTGASARKLRATPPRMRSPVHTTSRLPRFPLSHPHRKWRAA